MSRAIVKRTSTYASKQVYLKDVFKYTVVTWYCDECKCKHVARRLNNKGSKFVEVQVCGGDQGVSDHYEYNSKAQIISIYINDIMHIRSDTLVTIAGTITLFNP